MSSAISVIGLRVACRAISSAVGIAILGNLRQQ
jgi:hypothetical protein